MRTVSLDRAKPGDRLAEPVASEKGVLILPKGVKLTVAMLDSLRRRGVGHVSVEGQDPDAPPPKSTEELLADLDVRFRGLEANTVMMSIKSIVREHLLAKEKASE